MLSLSSRLGGSPLSSLSSSTASSLNMELCECGDTYVLKVDVPGYEKDEIKLSLNGNLLTVSTEPKDSGEARQKKEGEVKTIFCERTGGPFSRSIRIPNDVDFEQISAQHQLGQLIIKLQKSPEKSRTVSID